MSCDGHEAMKLLNIPDERQSNRTTLLRTVLSKKQKQTCRPFSLNVFFVSLNELFSNMIIIKIIISRSSSSSSSSSSSLKYLTTRHNKRNVWLTPWVFGGTNHSFAERKPGFAGSSTAQFFATGKERLRLSAQIEDQVG